ncbi:MAG: hypothetical protein IIV16_00295, partial [Alistipes sp.]|nr:hypothetical protein [Alistipes sp.]
DPQIYSDSLLTVVIGNKKNIFISISFNKNGNYVISKKQPEKEEIILDETIALFCKNSYLCEDKPIKTDKR